MFLPRRLLLTTLTVSLISACSLESSDKKPTIDTKAGNPATESELNSNHVKSIIDSFENQSFSEQPSIVNCTLSGGTKTKCLSISIKPQPANMNIGPWCPRNINDGPEKAGIWIENDTVFDADGTFIAKLAEFYHDDIWQLFDQQTGDINVTDSKLSCQAAARPDVDERYTNYCVECQVSYMDPSASTTFIIPINPTKGTDSNNIGRSAIGIAYSGALIDASAPTHAILAAHTLAPFDDCGGHVNLHTGYHLHAITNNDDCLKEVVNDNGHAPAIGLAMDGYPIHRALGINEENLDRCGGHEFNTLGYHYHAANPAKNKILACHTGETGCSLSDSSAHCDASKQTRHRGPPPHQADTSQRQ